MSKRSSKAPTTNVAAVERPEPSPLCAEIIDAVLRLTDLADRVHQIRQHAEAGRGHELDQAVEKIDEACNLIWGEALDANRYNGYLEVPEGRLQ